MLFVDWNRHEIKFILSYLITWFWGIVSFLCDNMVEAICWIFSSQQPVIQWDMPYRYAADTLHKMLPFIWVERACGNDATQYFNLSYVCYCSSVNTLWPKPILLSLGCGNIYAESAGRLPSTSWKTVRYTRRPGPRFIMKMTSYQYRISYTDNMTFLY